MKISLSVDPQHEIEEIVNFLKRVRHDTGLNNVVIGISGGVDSATVFHLLKLVYPAENIYPAIMNYRPTNTKVTNKMLSDTGLPKNNILDMSIKPIVDEIDKRLSVDSKVRKGNLMARVRMITLFDLAKKVNGLVCGTENKSERLLGYFTRFGDAASDLEPITHLYKTQVYQLTKYLKLPGEIIKAKPTAGLWEGQSDEVELGFTYKEADQVLHLYNDKKNKLETILKMGYGKAPMIVGKVLANRFKSLTPYKLV